MTIYSGTQTNVYCVVETTYGTAVDPSSTTKQYNRLGLESSVAWNLDNSPTNVKRLGARIGDDTIVGPGVVSGNVDFTYHQSVPFFWILGGMTSADGSAPYTWTIDDAATVKSFTCTVIQDGTNDTDYQLVGCLANSLSFGMDSSGAPATGTMNFIAQNYDLSGVTTPSSVTINDSAPWSMPATNVEIPDGSDITTATGVTVDIAHNAGIVHSLGSRVGRGYHPGVLDVTGSVDFYVADAADAADLVQQALGSGTANSIAADVTETTMTIDAAYNDGDADTWEIDLNGITWSTAGLSFPLEAQATYSIGFIAENIQVQEEYPEDADANW